MLQLAGYDCGLHRIHKIMSKSIMESLYDNLQNPYMLPPIRGHLQPGYRYHRTLRKSYYLRVQKHNGRLGLFLKVVGSRSSSLFHNVDVLELSKCILHTNLESLIHNSI